MKLHQNSGPYPRTLFFLSISLSDDHVTSHTASYILLCVMCLFTQRLYNITYFGKNGSVCSVKCFQCSADLHLKDIRVRKLVCLAYYAPPSRPEGPRRCPDRGNAGGSLVFLSKFFKGSTVCFKYYRLLKATTGYYRILK